MCFQCRETSKDSMISQTIRTQPAIQNGAASLQRPRARAAAKGRILVVDDDPEVLSAIQMILQDEGYLVESSLTPCDAQKKLQKQPFDLVLTDLYANSENGHEPLADLRLLPPETVAIILFGSASLESAIQAIRQGA